MDIITEFEEYNRCGRNSLCAILYTNTNILSIGYNNYTPHININGKKLHIPSVHAEICAVKQLLDSCKKSTKKRIKVDMVVMRKTFDEEFANSKPCKHCIELLKSENIERFVNLRNITYFENGKFITESLKNIKNEHITRGWKRDY
jgi:deoxycytidylate deaminase